MESKHLVATNRRSQQSCDKVKFKAKPIQKLTQAALCALAW